MARIFVLFIWSYILLCGFFIAADANSQEFECSKNSIFTAVQSQQLLSQVQNQYSKISGIQAQFIQSSYMAALEVSETSSGQVWFAKPGLMKWEYSSPDKQTFLIRKDTMWLHQENERQLMIDNFRQVLISDLPVAFLVGLGDLKKDFSIITACKLKAGTLFNLRPNQGSIGASELDSFQLLVDGNLNPNGARIKDAGGNVTTIVLSQIVLNKPVSESVFAASFPKGLDVIDRRRNKEQA